MGGKLPVAMAIIREFNKERIVLREYRGHCSNTAQEIIAAMRAIERLRDKCIRSLGQADPPPFAAGQISRFQQDIAALKSLGAFVLEEGAREAWEARVSPAQEVAHER
jgi:hypothetical protein